MIDWLYRTSLEVSLLIGLVLILRPMVRHLLGAHISYWLWLIPVIRCFMWSKPELPAAIVEKTTMTGGETFLRVFPNPENFIVPSSIPFDWIWFTGFIFWITVRIVGWKNLQTCLKENSLQTNLPEALQSFVCSKIGLTKIQFYMTNIPSAPFVTGLIKPKIFLPEQFFTEYSQAQQKCVLAHELGHLKRNDLWLQVVGEIIRAVFWFNPIIHFAWTAFREDQELACDQYVLRHSSSEERYEYGRALVKGFHAHILPATLAFFSSKKERFIMLEKHKNLKLHNVMGITLCVLIAIFALTKAPKALAFENNLEDWTDKLSLNFENIPLSSVTSVISEFVGQHFVAPEEFQTIKLSLSIENVAAGDATRAILACHGYQIEVRNLGVLKYEDGMESLHKLAEEYGDETDVHLMVKTHDVDFENLDSKQCISSEL
jgi:beta-lactamase regulating signal transducer with metallopeptidase domain